MTKDDGYGGLPPHLTDCRMVMVVERYLNRESDSLNHFIEFKEITIPLNSEKKTSLVVSFANLREIDN